MTNNSSFLLLRIGCSCRTSVRVLKSDSIFIETLACCFKMEKLVCNGMNSLVSWLELLRDGKDNARETCV